MQFGSCHQCALNKPQNLPRTGVGKRQKSRADQTLRAVEGDCHPATALKVRECSAQPFMIDGGAI
jgi:hypothetical protein